MKYMAIIHDSCGQVGTIYVYGPTTKAELILEMAAIKDIKHYQISVFEIASSEIDPEILTVLGERWNQPDMFVWNRKK